MDSAEQASVDHFSRYADLAREIIAEAKQKHLVDSFRGDLSDVLNNIAEEIFPEAATSCDSEGRPQVVMTADEQNEALAEKLLELHDLHENPEVKRRQPLFGAFVSEAEDGSVVLTFAD